ncbi:MAG: dUTP diphosphatase [Oscillospiraceae bacterium]|nr:dUTP diphosphatase [Oscillospiraceae bacterium]
MQTLQLKLLSPTAKTPARQTAGSAGYDIFADLAEVTTIAPGETFAVPSGFSIALEPSFAAFIYARSGLGTRGIIPANCVGVIDSDYRGEILVNLKNTSEIPFTINPGDRVAQMVIAKCETPEIIICETLPETPRGSGGFGSTGA